MNEIQLSGTWDDDDQQPRTSVLQKRSNIFRQAVIDMWDGGVRDLEEIRNETGYSIQHIRNILKENGREVVREPSRTTDEVDQICKDYTEFQKVRDVLRKWKISYNTLYAILENRGVPLRRYRASPAKEDAVAMYTDGRNRVSDIFETTGVSPATMYSELNRREVPLRNETPRTDENLNRAIEMYVQGYSVVVIQNDTGISFGKLYKAIYELKIPHRTSGSKEGKVDLALDLYEKGAKTNDIVAQTGVSTGTLYRNIALRGVSKKAGKQSVGSIDRALELYDEGAQAQDITKLSGCSLREVRSALLKRGGNLRTGLPAKEVTKEHIELAMVGYDKGIDVDTIELDTLVSRARIYAELRRAGKELRP